MNRAIALSARARALSSLGISTKFVQPATVALSRLSVAERCQKRFLDAVQGHPRGLVGLWAPGRVGREFTGGLSCEGFGTRLDWIRTRQALGRSL